MSPIRPYHAPLASLRGTRRPVLDHLGLAGWLPGNANGGCSGR
jgi:hypothetical protein